MDRSIGFRPFILMNNLCLCPEELALQLKHSESVAVVTTGATVGLVKEACASQPSVKVRITIVRTESMAS